MRVVIACNKYIILLIVGVLSNLSIAKFSSSCNNATGNNLPNFIDKDNKYNLWPELISPHSLKYGQTLLGMEQAIDHIWNLQYPPDCSKVKYLISEGWYQGFGSELHGHGVALAFAVETNRVFLQKDGWTWRYRNPHCNSKHLKSWDCYFIPFSKCKINDAILSMLNVTTTSKRNHQRSHHHANNSANIESTAETATSFKDTIWTKEDDATLEQAVIKYGKKGKWKEIALLLPADKTDAHCYARWFHYLEKHIKQTRGTSLLKKDRDAMDKDDLNIHDQLTRHHGVLSINRITDITIDPITGKFIFDIKYAELSDQILMITNDVIGKFHKFVPTSFIQNILHKCTTLPTPQFYYFWWRAISVTYLIRPNKKTLELIQKHQDPVLAESKGKCISTYIRHGDKVWREMKYVPFSMYAQTALTMFNDPSIFTESQYPTTTYPISTSGNTLPRTTTATTTTTTIKSQQQSSKIFYFATEDRSIFAEAHKWGKLNNIEIRYSNLSKILLHNDEIHRPSELENHLPKNHEYEYFSYILHLKEILSCDVIICTIPSNYCRLIDELRSTIGGNANGYNADISTETCQHPPCIRQFGLANYEGPVYDPKTRIW